MDTELEDETFVNPQTQQQLDGDSTQNLAHDPLAVPKLEIKEELEEFS